MKNEENRQLEKNMLKLIECFNNIHQHPNTLSTSYSNWLRFISSNDFEFISYLTNLIIEHEIQLHHHQQQQQTSIKHETIDNAFFILKFLSSFHNELISPFTIHNTSFCKCLHSLFVNNNVLITDNFFYFYIQMLPSFNMTQQVISNVFNALPLLTEDSIVKDVMYFILNLTNNSEVESMVYETHHSNVHSHLFDELMLRVLHHEIKDDRQRGILRFIINIMNYEDKCCLYGNDLECLIDIVIEKLNCEQESEFKLLLLDCLVKVTQYDEYYHKLYKLEELTDLMEDYQGHNEESIEVKNKSKEIIVNIIDHRRMLH